MQLFIQFLLKTYNSVANVNFDERFEVKGGLLYSTKMLAIMILGGIVGVLKI